MMLKGAYVVHCLNSRAAVRRAVSSKGWNFQDRSSVALPNLLRVNITEGLSDSYLPQYYLTIHQPAGT